MCEIEFAIIANDDCETEVLRQVLLDFENQQKLKVKLTRLHWDHPWVGAITW